MGVSGARRTPITFFLVEHGMNVLVWAVSLTPPHTPGAVSESSGSSDSEDPSSDSTHTGNGHDFQSAGRSRSPRRGQVGPRGTRGPYNAEDGLHHQFTSENNSAALLLPSADFLICGATGSFIGSNAKVASHDDFWPRNAMIPLSGQLAKSGSVNCLRPVPTPCRGRSACVRQGAVPLPDVLSELSGTDFQTLLDVAGLTMAEPVLRAACCMLRPPPRVACLADTLLPSPDQSLVLDLVQLMSERGVMQKTVPEDWLDADLSRILASPDITPDVALRIASIQSWWASPDIASLQAICIYTDGSYKSQTGQLSGPCSWAFGVWMQCATGPRYYGHSAHAAVPRDTPYHLGESQDDAFTGELLGLAWALIWVLDQGCRFQVPITVMCDSTSAGGGTFGLVKQHQAAPPKQPSLPAFVLDLRLCASAAVHLVPGHVRSHTGVFGNEVADLLAKQAGREHEDCYCRCLPLWPGRLSTHPLRSWSWRLLEQATDLPTLYAFPSEAARLQCADLPIAPPPRLGQKMAHLRGTLVLDFHCVTFNALTLLDPVPKPTNNRVKGVEGMRLSGKRDLLKQRLLQHDICFAGLQETRIAETCELPDADFWMFHASCTSSGQYGTALWIRKHARLGLFAGSSCCLEHDYFTVVHAEPRLLITAVSAPFLRFVIIVAHGPFDRTTGPCPFSFWDQVTALLCKFPPTVPILVLGDCNAHVGSCLTSAIGDVCPEQENQAGEACSSSTWFSPHGTGRRLDFVAGPSTWLTP